MEHVEQLDSRGFKPKDIVLVTLADDHKVGNPWHGTPAKEFFAEGVTVVEAIFECVGPEWHQCSVLIPKPKDPHGPKWRMHVSFDDIKLKPKPEPILRTGIKPLSL